MILVENISSKAMEKLGATYNCVFLGILLAVVGSWMSFPYATSITGGIFFMIVILEFAVLFGFIFTKNPIMYYAFTFITGVTLVPVLSQLISVGAGHVITQALSLTAVITGGLTFYASTTKKNYLGMGTILFWILVGVVVVAIINIFIGSSIITLMISYAAAILFSFLIIHDTQQVLYTDIEPIDAAMGLYLDILNMFVSLLHILTSGIGDD